MYLFLVDRIASSLLLFHFFIKQLKNFLALGFICQGLKQQPVVLNVLASYEARRGTLQDRVSPGRSPPFIC